MIADPEVEPYVGLRPYDIDDADRFFGRSRESWELTSLFLSSRLVVVYGRPGVGKTSLVQAGVLARLSQDMAYVLPVGRIPRASTLPTMATPGHNPFTFELLSSWAPDSSADAIRGLTISQFLGNVPVALDRYDETPLPMIAVIDQFDEVFRGGEDWAPRREELFDQLAEAVEDIEHLHLVLSMRQDVVGELLPYELKLSGGNRRRYQVKPLDPRAALDAVTRPLGTTSRSFAPGAAEALVDQLRTTTITNEMGEQRTVVAPTVEPINLQVVCSALWRGLPAEVTTITTEHLRDFGDVEDTLTSFCVSAVIDVATRQSVPEPAVWEWLEKTFITDLGTRNLAYEGVAWTGGMPNAVARAFEDHRILRSEERSGSVWFELLHDGLIEPIRRGKRLSEGLSAIAGPDARPDDYLLRAENALHSGLLPLAEEYARGAVGASEHDRRALAEAKSFLGKLAFDHGRAETGPRAERLYATAEDNFRRAAELFEAEQNRWGVGRVLASLGQLFMQRGRYTDAVAELRSAVERLPGDVDIRLDFARALNSAGQPSAALGQYTAVLTQAPDEAKEERAEALVGLGTLGAVHGDPAAALRDLDTAIRLRPDLAERSDVVLARSRAFARLERRP